MSFWHAKPLTLQNLHDLWRAGGEVRFQTFSNVLVIAARPVIKRSKKLKGTGDWDEFMKAVVTAEQINMLWPARATTMLDLVKTAHTPWREVLPPVPVVKAEAAEPQSAVGDKRPAEDPAEDPNAKRLQVATGDQAVPDGAGTGGTAGCAGGVDDDDDAGRGMPLERAEELGGQKLGVLRQAFADTLALINGPMLTARDLKRALQRMADFKETVADQSSALEAVVHIVEAIEKPVEPGLVITIDD